MWETLTRLFDTAGFPPRWHCGIWSEELGWLHIGSDVAIFGAYTAIPVVLAYFVMRKPDIPFPRVFWLFVAFIFACGSGHLIEAVIFWHPVYRLAGAVKLFTAIASWATVLALAQILPEALRFPGLAKLNSELQQSNDQLRRTMDHLQEQTGTLQAEIVERRRTEAQLGEHARELEQFNRLAVGRELRMIELKREVNELNRSLGLPPRYDVEELTSESRS